MKELIVIIVLLVLLIGITVAYIASEITQKDKCDLDQSGDLNIRDLSILAEQIRNQK